MVTNCEFETLQCKVASRPKLEHPKFGREWWQNNGNNNRMMGTTTKWWKHSQNTLTLRSVSSLNNPQNSEMKVCEKMKLKC